MVEGVAALKSSVWHKGPRCLFGILLQQYANGR